MSSNSIQRDTKLGIICVQAVNTGQEKYVGTCPHILCKTVNKFWRHRLLHGPGLNSHSFLPSKLTDLYTTIKTKLTDEINGFYTLSTQPITTTTTYINRIEGQTE